MSDVLKESSPLHEFEAHTGNNPDTIALILGEEHLTYHELNRRANQLGHFLRRQGIRPEMLVGVFLERSLDLVIGILGVLKAGGAVIPLEPSYPSQRITFMLEDGQPSLALTHLSLRDRISLKSFSSLCLDAKWNEIAREGSENLTGTLRDGNLMVVFYTSGSTGNPKGVLEVHQEITQPEMEDFQSTSDIAFDVSDRFLCKCPISFAPSFWEILTPLSWGGTLVLARPGGEQDFTYLLGLIVEHQISVMHFVPSGLRLFLAQPEVATCTSVKHVISSGEFLSEEVRQQFFVCFDASLHYYYAATEAPAATILHLHGGNREQPLTFNKGETTKVHVLSSEYEEVPSGIQGEAHIEAKGKIRGYLGKPALTAEKFVPDPLSPTPGSRLYKTGDLACYTEKDSIALQGRRDFQIKLRGIRIELGEIESALKQHPTVMDAIVTCCETISGEKQLVAYIVGVPISDPNPTIIQRDLQKVLPSSMVPASILVMDAFPLTPNGKIDRQALPTLQMSRATLPPPYAPTQTLVERLLATIWQEVLKIELVGRNDDFLALGGHSVLATQILAQLRDQHQIEAPLRIVFDHPVLVDQAIAIEKILLEKINSRSE